MRLKILVVDDEKPICDWLVYCISRISDQYEVFSANNGEVAFQLACEHKPDMVFTDIDMPGMDGLTLMKEISSKLAYTTFVILTNYADFSYAQEAVSLGAKKYLLKSELRAADVETILAEMAAKKQSIRQQKNNEYFESGCIDLYQFYQENRAEEKIRFWVERGMQDGENYLVLCVRKGRSNQDWNQLAEQAIQIRLELQEISFAVAGSSKHHEYIILQGNISLETVRTIHEKLRSYDEKIGVSNLHNACVDIREAMREAAVAYDSLFFADNKNLERFALLATRQPLDWTFLRASRDELTVSLRRKRYQELPELLDRIFSQLSKPGVDDVHTALKYCTRLVLLFDDRQMIFQPEEPEDWRPHSLDECRRRCSELLQELENQLPKTDSAAIGQAVKYIHNHYGEKISLAKVEGEVYLSPEYFSRLFKEQTGQNFSTYLTLYRLERAHEMVRESDFSIAEIAERTGYSSAGYFVAQYRKYYGYAPGQERKHRS